ncbi:hypothetical protein MMC25_007766 [Agyrium rufum]|nr:hypothetical protein [Agyrium rufum]
MPFVEVLPNSTTTVSAPGWAYVPDTGYDPSKAPIQPSGARKRARTSNINGISTAAGETQISAKQQNQLNRRLTDLDKDNHRDIQIPIPNRQKDASGRSTAKGKTAATRKILMAQKTFANYIDDEVAFAAQQEQQQHHQGQASVQGAGTKHRASVPHLRTQSTSNIAPSIPAPLPTKDSPASEERRDSQSAPPLDPYYIVDPADEHLLASTVPEKPSEALLEALLTAPALTWNAARVGPSRAPKPQRHFCEICGYWGRVKCMQCGAKVCGLSCKETHDSERCQSFYA